jgi:hypothetical protein
MFATIATPQTVQHAAAIGAIGIAAPTLPLFYSQVALQSANLRQDGYSVRNTFIDSPVVWWESCTAAPRSHSSPPVACREPTRFVERDERPDEPGSSSSDHSGSYATAPAGGGGGRASSRNSSASAHGPVTDVHAPGAGSSSSRCSSVIDLTPTAHSDELSTACSDSGGACSSGERGGAGGAAELSQDDRHALQSISDTVERYCAFLRLNGHTLHVEHSTRMRSRGVVATLRFYAYGLPWPKRAKWVQPLCRSVAAVLRHNGCEAKMMGGELQVSLHGGSSAAVVRVDFSAARL